MASRTTLALCMAACLALSAAAALPPFSQTTAIPFLQGVTYFLDPVTFSSGGAAVVNGTTFIRATITPAGLVTEQGTYTSWQCGTEPGSYVALTAVTTTNSDNTTTTVEKCEYGVLDMTMNTVAMDQAIRQVLEKWGVMGNRVAGTERWGDPNNRGI
ncbi:hypothetical protein CHLNCDRAFT_55220 [Chlorella variabilis]|uniref:Uncharacterized protein n=1 Tax=Chlorella variabilis TaxID=554065 RepID=E1ZS94_CHLVA|nr:hypothetical protein CHLNCDRAFT_55220 [Chlorella variabilis]EFN51208.1 hypothetical protein CHLNCDRAFT_55220 [Chlorella variabilis]|eukprot:XP_005843310.1 hypothetical protein CHLNCDRAFT_55220 [Chlorella variabilis]